MIRDKFQKDILSTLDKHNRFERSDFKIEPIKEPRNSFTTLTIKFIVEPKYKIVFKIPTSQTVDKDGYSSPYYALSGSVCPGPFSFEETFEFKNTDGIFERITSWLSCIWEELSANPTLKQIENQQQQIDEIFVKFDSIKDEYFTEQEATELRSRLDSLEETLKSQIEQNNEDKKVFEEEVSKLHNDIDTLKLTVQSFKKKGWLKIFTNKVYKWSKDSDNRNMLMGGYEIIRELLPNDIKDSLPNIK